MAAPDKSWLVCGWSTVYLAMASLPLTGSASQNIYVPERFFRREFDKKQLMNYIPHASPESCRMVQENNISKIRRRLSAAFARGQNELELCKIIGMWSLEWSGNSADYFRMLRHGK